MTSCLDVGDVSHGIRHEGVPGIEKDWQSFNLLLRTSRQMRPSLSTFGWNILVKNRILGGVIG